MTGRRPHIVLVGFMGSGKTSIGKMLAVSLGRPFIDTDEEIVKTENISIPKIFTTKGEAYFRKVESKVLQDVLLSEVPSIISTGGGAPCHLDGIKYVLEKSHSFYLKVGRGALLERIYGDKSRPLVKAKTKQELKQFITILLREREEFYKKADKTIMANDLPENIKRRIIKYIDKQQV